MIAPSSSARCSGWQTSSGAIKANRRERSGPQRERRHSLWNGRQMRPPSRRKRRRIVRLGTCESARGPDADRHVKLLIQFAVEGSLSGAYSQWVRLGEAPTAQHVEEDLRMTPSHIGVALAFGRLITEISPAIDYLLGRPSA